MSSRGFGTHGRAFLRVAGRKSGESRWIRALYRGGSVTLASVGKALRALWLEVTGFLFLALAVVGGAATLQQYRNFSAGGGSRAKVLMALVFTLMFAYFGVSSFWRSKRKS